MKSLTSENIRKYKDKKEQMEKDKKYRGKSTAEDKWLQTLRDEDPRPSPTRTTSNLFKSALKH